MLREGLGLPPGPPPPPPVSSLRFKFNLNESSCNNLNIGRPVSGPEAARGRPGPRRQLLSGAGPAGGPPGGPALPVPGPLGPPLRPGPDHHRMPV